jgi:hypothetical protein
MMSKFQIAVFYLSSLIVFGFSYAQAAETYFDLETFKQIIEESPQAQPQDIEIRIKEFFQSAAFAFDAQTVEAIRNNGHIYTQVAEANKIKFTFFHAILNQIVDPEYTVKASVNPAFIKALIKVQGEAIHFIAAHAKDFFQVKKFSDRDQAYYTSMIYYSCLQSMAVRGVEVEKNCMDSLNEFVTTDFNTRAQYEAAYIVAYRIARLKFIGVSDDIFLNPTNMTSVTITEDLVNLKYIRSALTADEFNKLAIFKYQEFLDTPECQLSNAGIDQIEAYRDSQAGCLTGRESLFYKMACASQQTDKNKKLVSLPFTQSLKSPKVPMLAPSKPTEEATKFVIIQPLRACAKKYLD